MQTTTATPTETQKKITLATLKSFIRKNADSLFCKTRSRFDGMTDSIEQVEDFFGSVSAEKALGLQGVYIVGGSRDRFRHFEDESFVGIEVSNCCGRGILAVKK
jgi:hypothetical protein